MSRLGALGLRVLMTIDAVGGVWRYALDAGAELRRRGAEVALVGMGPRPSAGQQREAEAAGIALFWRDVALDWQAANAETVRANAILLEPVIRNWSPTVLHINNAPLATVLGRGTPCLVAAHSCLSTWWAAVKGTALPDDWGWHRDMTRDGFTAADVVVTPTQAYADALQQVYGGVPHLRVVQNGGAPITPAAKQPMALAIGRWWDEGKGATTLAQAAGLTRHPIFAAGPVAGSGAVAKAGAVRWLGEFAHDEVRNWMAEASVFVSPALYEPFGLAVLEAAHAGAALVLSDIPSFRELWDGCAEFVPPRDAKGVAAAIDRLFQDDARRHALVDAAQLRAGRFTVARQVNGLLEAYGAAIAVRRQAA